jgi:hypothetical protein
MCTVTGLDDIPEIIRWLNSLPDEIDLCVGGPRANECADAFEIAKAILEELSMLI